MAVMRVIPLAKSHRWPRGPRAQDMTHQHPFFLKSHAEQKRFQARLVSVSLLFIGAVSALLYLAGLLPLIFLVFALVLSIIAPFLDVPAMVRSGRLRYYSPFLLGEAERNSTLVLHAGTLFDSWFLFRKGHVGKRAKTAGDGRDDRGHDQPDRGAQASGPTRPEGANDELHTERKKRRNAGP